ncbi:unnamed protein product [Moneuplotes crassus]|uniref:Uncharacterized protein n=1 Tax=Euplotes crassus TaxID=5936 RepID=A0AAD1URJ6_EUPCR|nr:unnamed protein product [Moneuplotes crassus]
MRNCFRKCVAILTLLFILSCAYALKSSNILQDNVITTQEGSNKNGSDKASKKIKPGIIRTPGANKQGNFTFWDYSKNLQWEKMKTAVHSRKEVILYSSSIVIFTIFVVLFIKAIKSKYDNSQFNDKNLFDAKSMFKKKARSSYEKKGQGDNGLNTILEDANESYDVENFNKRETCKTIYEDRYSDTYGQFSNQRKSSKLGENFLEGYRNVKEGKISEEPDVSTFSTDRSEDYPLPHRNFMKNKFEKDELEKAAYLKEKENAIFGMASGQSDYDSKQGIQDQIKTQIKFNFSESESEFDDLSENPRQEDLNNINGRETIDLNGPLYDPATFKKKVKGCMSEFSQAESEANDMNKLLHNMEANSLKDVEDDVVSNSSDSRVNQGAMLRSRHQNRDMEDIFF